MHGKIALEEAWAIEENFEAYDVSKLAPKGVIGGDLVANLLDVHGERLRQMNENGIDLMVLSLSSPGAQGVADPARAAALASLANDRLEAEVARNPRRFAGLASVSMHDPAQAAGELRRRFGDNGGGPTGGGLVGVMLNDYQTGPADDKNQMIFFDGPEYDVFWAAAEELDVPVYLHPREATPLITEQMWRGRPWLAFSALGYAHRVGMHLLGIVTNGVLDRFPRLKIVIGHMGEHIPYDLYRIDHKLNRARFPQMPMAGDKLVRDYFGTNLFITTSGHFSTPALVCAMHEVGARAVMFSVDYPFESIPNGCVWFDEHVARAVGAADLVDMGRNNALGVFSRLADSRGPHAAKPMSPRECRVGGLGLREGDESEVEYGLYNRSWSKRLEMKE
ncbi:2,3-dihydroxybenzoic acid decarboxylase [Gaeumannomyces tritici R3-111a-1]|uniref:2,3-dihydroxybenzoic acid decarboxylase n=1 Tax=Gaeumannomyces tritici (strain R3-111a-1) TaxID=644352 RepID=J3PKR8_GAET3|nr:2,3-dihydroxybenzoic acid decarboxylase [Gaeumannomyces tritici R3-111a-1]EJT68288.1 2,3-dihydroxybenzoic acid decarboxylase [Gaeumannomyces tritici R3-111a-1]